MNTFSSDLNPQLQTGNFQGPRGHFQLLAASKTERTWKSLSRIRFYDSMDYRERGILQARILEWVAIPSPADLPDPGTKPESPALQADSLPTELSGKLLPVSSPPNLCLVHLALLMISPSFSGASSPPLACSLESHGSCLHNGLPVASLRPPFLPAPQWCPTISSCFLSFLLWSFLLSVVILYLSELSIAYW